MYAFLIVITIALPHQPKHVFRFWSHAQYSESRCNELAEKIEERRARYIVKRVRFARITTETSCAIRPTRAI